jgi:hypothetical protein
VTFRVPSLANEDRHRTSCGLTPELPIILRSSFNFHLRALLSAMRGVDFLSVKFFPSPDIAMASSSWRTFLLTLTALFAAIDLSASQALIGRGSGNSTQCYYPDGSLAVDYDFVPCTSTGVSACCVLGEGDVCMPDGLCNWTGHYLYRGSCTSESWDSTDCPDYCGSCLFPSVYLNSSICNR